MPSLTPQELQEARLRSGRLGGRPPKRTVGEARAQALEELVPEALRVLREELEVGGPQAVRAALRIVEHQWGSPRAQVEMTARDLDPDELDLRKLSMVELGALRRSLEGRRGSSS